jgi:CheY-like chemotaxis protein
VGETLQSVEPAAQDKGVAILAHVQATPTLVEGDPRRLQQVVGNLLTNAIKFTPRGGRVTVSTRVVDGHCRIQVTDTGEGIAPEFLPFLFERFRQGDASRSRRHGGLGLGLAISNELVALHGGTVGGESDGPGRGARFTVTLPVLVAGADAGGDGRSDTSAIQPASLAGVQALVVDDQPDALDYVGRVLEEQGARVVRANSAREALARLRDANQAFDVLVTDIGMPETSGYDFLRIVREELHLDGARLPAIAVTAFAREEDRTRSLQAGFQQHLAKPVQVVELIHAVRAAIPTHRPAAPNPARAGGA